MQRPCFFWQADGIGRAPAPMRGYGLFDFGTGFRTRLPRRQTTTIPSSTANPFGESQKIFTPSLETKSAFANFFVATGWWRPGALWARNQETGTGRVRCRS